MAAEKTRLHPYRAKLLSQRFNFDLFIDPQEPFGQPDDLNVLRLLDAALDSIETFFVSRRSALRIIASDLTADRLRSDCIKLPSFDIEVIGSGDLLAKVGVGKSACAPEHAWMMTRLIAASSQEGVTLALTPGVFPIRPFSSDVIVDRCKKILDVDESHSAPADLRRAIGLFDCASARRSLYPLKKRLGSAPKGGGEGAANAALVSGSMLASTLAECELGFWTTDKTKLSPPLLQSVGVEEWTRDASWGRQPWKTTSEPHFVYVEDAACAAEKVIARVYAAFDR